MHKVGTGFITTTKDVDTLAFDWGTIHMLSEPLVTGAQRHSFGVVEVVPGGGHGRHNHPGAEEIIYVLEGEVEQMIDDQPPVRIGAGASVFIPDSVYHSTLNVGSGAARLIVIYAPAGSERLLREIPGVQIIPPSAK